MRALRQQHWEERFVLPELRESADQAFSRAAGAPLIGGNRVRLLKNAGENYPAWLDAIRAAKHHVHFESYIIHEDDIGREFAGALVAKAHQGVPVRLIYDWMGGFGKASRRFWKDLRSGGVEVRCYNPPQLDSPLGWLSRDHRKMLAIDGEVGFITGLCVGRMWAGDPARGIDPWRDTGVEVRGPSVGEIERAFARIWSMMGEPIRDGGPTETPARAGEMSVRIVASEPATAGMLRLDQLVAALARKRLWLTDAYYAGTTAYVQALRAAAADGVDVRLLVPNGTDIPLLRPLSRAGYRPLLESGVRVFEWNGTMLHAKTAAADGHWARVGSTNLNIASWFGNWELDAVIEDSSFATEMEQMYVEDLANATEVVLDEKRKLRAPGEPLHPHAMSSGGGSGGRAAAGAVRIGNAIGAAFTNRRVLGPIEARLMATGGLLLCALAILFVFFPLVLVYPAVALCAWGGLVLIYRGYQLHRGQKQGSRAEEAKPPG
ncbi:MAG TPA: phospholipase D-like domain-containing protein [Bryobacteraceae bacterium]|nr:phospholipase D-like domain-containing protein [Bryobacteraceae bacterium]